MAYKICTDYTNPTFLNLLTALSMLLTTQQPKRTCFVLHRTHPYCLNVSHASLLHDVASLNTFDQSANGSYVILSATIWNYSLEPTLLSWRLSMLPEHLHYLHTNYLVFVKPGCFHLFYTYHYLCTCPSPP